MKEIVFSKRSWVYHFLSFMTSKYRVNTLGDICGLIRLTIWSLIKLAFFSCVIGFLCFAVGMVVIASNITAFIGIPKTLIEGAFTVKTLLLGITVGAVTIPIFIALVLGIAFLLIKIFKGIDHIKYKYYEKLKDRTEVEEPVEKKPGPIASMYRSFKEKTCFKIRFD